MFLRGTRWVLYLILPVHLGLIVFGRPFLTIWLGDPDYADRCYPALVILSSTLTLVVAQSVASRVLYGTGRLKSFARMALVEAGLNVGVERAALPAVRADRRGGRRGGAEPGDVPVGDRPHGPRARRVVADLCGRGLAAADWSPR